MASRPPSPPYRVQLVIGPELEYFRDVVLGVRRYGFETGRMVFSDRWLGHEMTALPKMVARDGVQGIVAAINSRADEAKLAALGVPVVNVSNAQRAQRVPMVTQDDVVVGRLAAEHLLACGCRSFGFWGQNGASYSEQRRQGFLATLRAAGMPAPAEGGSPQNERDGPARYGRMKRWLGRLGAPAGVFAVLDSYALTAMRAARELGRRVPEDLAVLGAGDDDFFVEFERVPLSSIRLPARRIGHEAAALLDRMLGTGTRQADSLQLGGSELVVRRSTDVRFTDDAGVARAMKLIRERPSIRVAEVALAAGVARSGLQSRFHAALGRGLLAEIQRVRLMRAQGLLTTTDLKIEDVAAQAGYPNVQRLFAAFRTAHACTPGAYRLKNHTSTPRPGRSPHADLQAVKRSAV